MSENKIRIKDIAALASVSVGTVDRVLHNRGEVAEKTREKVLEIVKETEYSPNVMAQALKLKKKFNITSLLPEPNESNSFWMKHPAGMKKAIRELEPFPISLRQITFDIFSEADFQAKTRTILADRPDGVLLAPIFKAESTLFCRKLKEANIPFVFVDGFIDETDFLSYTGENIYQSGRVAGQLTDMVTPEKGDIILVNIARNLQNIHHLNNRTMGFLNYFETSGINCGKKLILNISDPSLSSVFKALEKTFRRNKNICSVFMTGSKSHLIASYLQEKNIRNVNVVGYDLLDKNVEFLKSGIIKFLIGQRPEEQTYRGIKKLFEYLSLNKTPEKIDYLPVDVVTSENVDFFI
jgi:LacI family transcriptional regulator